MPQRNFSQTARTSSRVPNFRLRIERIEKFDFMAFGGLLGANNCWGKCPFSIGFRAIEAITKCRSVSAKMCEHCIR
jgi:hypothetical protein